MEDVYFFIGWNNGAFLRSDHATQKDFDVMCAQFGHIETIFLKDTSGNCLASLNDGLYVHRVFKVNADERCRQLNVAGYPAMVVPNRKHTYAQGEDFYPVCEYAGIVTTVGGNKAHNIWTK